MKTSSKIILAIIAGLFLGNVAYAAFFSQSFSSGAALQNSAITVNLNSPTGFSVASTTGSVGTGTLYFRVTALDGIGETTGSAELATTTQVTTTTTGYNFSWTPVQGATSYRLYFSTTTPGAENAYFVATSTSGYYFNSTSTPQYGSIPTATTAYVNKINNAGTSWFNGGNFVLGSTTAPSLFSVMKEPTGNGTVATTTVDFGDYATSTSKVCFNAKNTAGTAISFYFVGTSMVVESNRCR